MNNNKLYLIAVIILAVSLFSGSIVIGDSLNNISNQLQKLQTLGDDQSEKNILSLKEAAEYLSIQPQTLQNTIETTSVGIPYLKLEDKYIFTKGGLDKWLESNHIDLDY